MNSDLLAARLFVANSQKQGYYFDGFWGLSKSDMGVVSLYPTT